MTRRAAPDDQGLDAALPIQPAPRRAAAPDPDPSLPRRAAREPEPTAEAVLDHPETDLRVVPATAVPTTPTPATTAGKRRPRWVVLVLVGALVLLGAGVFHGLGAPDRQRVRTATETVSGYLSAISRGDAATAVSLLATEGADVSLLTDEVLAASADTAELTDIAIGEVTLIDDGTAEVPVSYHLGATRVNTTMDVVLDGDTGQVRGAGLIDLSGVAALNPLVNGVAADTSQPLVFPGSYQVTIDNPYLEAGSPTQQVTSADSVVTTVDLNLVATQAGTEMFRQKVGEAVQACLASKALDPGCGAGLPTTLSSGETIIDGTISRSLSATDLAALGELVPEPDPARPTILTASSAKLGTLVLEADVHTSSRTVRATLEGYGQGFGFARAAVDVTDPALSVVWG